MNNFDYLHLLIACQAEFARRRLWRAVRRLKRELAGMCYVLGFNRLPYGHLRYCRTWAVKFKRRVVVLDFAGAGLRLSAAVLLLGLVTQTFGGGISATLAYFDNRAESQNNGFAAGALDLTLTPNQVYQSPLLYPSDTAQTDVQIGAQSSVPYEYRVFLEVISNDQACQYFTVTATDGHSTQTATLPDWSSPTSTPESLPQNLNFTFKLGNPVPIALWGQSCFFKISLDGWALGSAPGSGFFDHEERLGQLRIGRAVVLNEFLPNPVGADNAAKPNGEWVELYNNSNIDFDLTGWTLFDNNDNHELFITDANTNTGGHIIAAHGFLVVYRNGDPDFALNNDSGDSVRLFDGYPASAHNLVDAYTYTAPKPEGFSFARIPDGVGAWVDPIPTPGQPNLESLGDWSLEQLPFLLVLPPAPAAGQLEKEPGADNETASEDDNTVETSANQTPAENIQPETSQPETSQPQDNYFEPSDQGQANNFSNLDELPEEIIPPKEPAVISGDQPVNQPAALSPAPKDSDTSLSTTLE